MKIKNVSNLIKNEVLFKNDIKRINIPNTNISLAKLTTDNVRKVEINLRLTVNYPQFLNFNFDDNYYDYLVNKINEEKIFNKNKALTEQEYCYLSIFYMLEFMLAKKEKRLDKKLYLYLINAILRKISLENKVKIDNVTLSIIANNICNEFTPDELLESLKEPYDKDNYHDCEYKLIKCICKNADLTLASTFCHHFNFNIYLETEYVDLFSIYDDVMIDNIYYYYNYYVSKENNINKHINNDYNLSEIMKLDEEEKATKLVDIYRNYQELIDDIINVTKISRNGLYHLISNNYRE